MMMKKITLSFMLIIAMLAGDLLAESGPLYRRYNVHRGNLVKTVFGNWGVVGQPADKGPRGAWIYDNNGYVGDVSPMVGVKVTSGGTSFHSVVVTPVDRPTLGGTDQSPDGNKFWGFEPVSGYFNSTIEQSKQRVAISTDSKTWPTSWPDKDASWNGAWNGYFGKQSNADVESYYVMDDDADEEWNFYPDENDHSRRGVGLEVSVRSMQSSYPLLEDIV